MIYRLLLASLVLTLMGCSSEKKENLDLPTRVIADVEPFCVEHYEIEDGKETFLILYLNRDIKRTEEAGIRVDLTTEKNGYSYGVFPIYKDTKDQILRIQLPFKDRRYATHFPDIAEGGKFVKSIRDLSKGKDVIKEFKLFLAWTEAPSNSKFSANGAEYTLDDALEFKEADIKPGKKYNRLKSSRFWWTTHWRYYEGEFDSTLQKQGDWKWNYANGNTKATAHFENDSLVGWFVFYRYTGEIQDSISFQYDQGEKQKVKKSFDRNGELLLD